MSARASRFYGLPKLEGEERKKAIEQRGPTWREFAIHELLKWWYGLGSLVVDSWIIAGFLQPLDLALMIPSLLGATYLEFLGWRFLWYEPSAAHEPDEFSIFRTRWFRPVRYGRWSKAAAAARTGRPIIPEDPTQPGVEEFL